MEVTCKNGVLHIAGIEGLSAAACLFCGQAFRWTALPDGAFEGVVHGARRRLIQTGDAMTIFPVQPGEADYFVHYFALNDDYPAILALLSRNPVLRRCIESTPGIRVLHQDFFEMLLTFIISQNNNIPRIHGIVERLCEAFGAPLADGAFAFPTPNVLAEKTPADLAVLRAGWRAGYLLDAACKVADGTVSEEALRTLSLNDARGVLQTIRGVGPKVADCVLLFGLDRQDAFPTDVWMKRAMKTLFPKGLPRYCAPYAGIAQQFIFDYARRNPSLFT